MQQLQPLTDEELALLASIERDWDKLDPMARTFVDVPRRLFDYGLVARHDNGCLIISDGGKRALFQRRCSRCLAQIELGDGTPGDEDALRWLERAAFIKRESESDDAPRYSVTRRGQMWRDN